MVVAATAIGVTVASVASALAGYRPETDYPAGTQALNVALADVIGKRPADLIVTSQDDDAITVFKGKGNGKFGGGQPYAGGVDPLGIAVGDFNRDGLRDIAVADQNSPDGGVTVLLRADIGFEVPSRFYPTAGQANYVVTKDFNNDGKLDLAVSDSISDDVAVLKGDGKGHFAEPLFVHDIPEAFGIAAGDFDRDGNVDLAVTGIDADAVAHLYVLTGKGNGKFLLPSVRTFGTNLPNIVASDLDGNRRLDLAVVDYGEDAVHVLRGRRDGSFRAPRDYNAGTLPTGITVTRSNNDKIPDLAIADEPGGLAVLEGTGQAKFAAPKPVGLSDGTENVASAKLNADGKPDLAASLYSNGAAVLVHK
jgi:FG-GAP-like repeat